MPDYNRKTKNTISLLQENIGHKFNTIELLNMALVHRSYSSSNNERLEFLGDAILDAGISDVLYNEFPNINEGELSRIRSNIVRQEYLAEIANKLNLSNYIMLGMGEIKTGGLNKSSILSGALEAILGAIYLDGGFNKVLEIIHQWIKFKIIDLNNTQKDSKTMLQEYLQSRKYELPKYILLKTNGLDHEQTFEINCIIISHKINVTAVAPSKKEAEQKAAAIALQQIMHTDK